MHFDSEGNQLSDAIVRHLNNLYKGNKMNDVNVNEVTPELAKSLEDVAKQPEVVFTQTKEQVGDESKVAA